MNGSLPPKPWLLQAQGARADLTRIKEILALRLLLEPEIAALAAANATPKDLERIRHILSRQEQAARQGDSAAADDQHFHLALARASKNEVFREVVAVLYDMLSESRAQSLQSPERERISLHGHERIVAALESRDPAACRLAMEDHLKTLESRLFSGSEPGPRE